MKLREVAGLSKQVMMIFGKKIKKMNFGERKTKLRPNTSRKLDDTKPKRIHHRPPKKEKVTAIQEKDDVLK